MPAIRKNRHTAANRDLFKNRDEETNKMLELRHAGYSNHQIAAKIGVTHNTVLRRIGKQSNTLTRATITLGMKAHHAKNTIRKQEAKLQAARRYNELATEINNHIIAITEARKKLQAVKPSAVKNVPVIPMMNVIPMSAIAQ